MGTSRPSLIAILAAIAFWLTCGFGALSFIVHWNHWDEWWGDLWLNLAAASLSVLVTVLVVERILKAHEDARWDGVRTVINRRVGVAIAHVATGPPSLLWAMKYRGWVENKPQVRFVDLRTDLHFARRFITDEVLPDFIPGEMYRSPGWDVVVPHFYRALFALNQITILFDARWNPALQEAVLDLQDRIESFLLVYEERFLKEGPSPPVIVLQMLGTKTREICEAALNVISVMLKPD
jgi:hypothetical protein